MMKHIPKSTTLNVLPLFSTCQNPLNIPEPKPVKGYNKMTKLRSLLQISMYSIRTLDSNLGTIAKISKTTKSELRFIILNQLPNNSYESIMFVILQIPFHTKNACVDTMLFLVNCQLSCSVMFCLI